MSQNALVIPDGSGAAVLASLNLALDTLNTLNSGPGAPGSPEAYMLWADTGTGYLKQRNAANNAWVALRPLDFSAPLSTNVGNAYAITLAPAITAYVGGVVYKFTPNASSTGAPTLAINGLAAVAIAGATLTANQPLLLIYDATDNLFILLGGGGSGTPVGGFIPFGGAAAPTGWLLCNGAPVSRVTYANLFAVLGVAFGAGDGSTTFNLPNMALKLPLGAGTGVALGSSGGALNTAEGAPVVTETEIAAAVSDTIINVVTAVAGSGDTITPPYLAVNFIIKY
jgi:hypothetical protein